MSYYLKLYFTTLAAFLVIDITWLGLVARSFYKKHLGYLMAPSPNWIAAIIFYLLFIAGVLVFVVLPGLKENSLKITLVWRSGLSVSRRAGGSVSRPTGVRRRIRRAHRICGCAA
jgi:uncharacterized membrane protein